MSRVFFLLLSFSWLADNANAGLQIEQPPRSFGYFIGDVLLQRINLDSDITAAQEPDLTPARIGPYVYRLPSALVRENDQRWLELRYQIINAPTATKTISLPAVTLTTASGDVLSVEPWPFSISPLSPADARTVLPDRSALAVLGDRDASALTLSLAALLAALLLWLVWWIFRTVRDDRTLPFAKANRAIKRLPKARRDAEPNAWIALHHAFNSVAGKTVSTASVADIFSAAPWLERHQDAIEQFYSASAARFFQQSDAPQVVAVAALCDALYRLEKRQAKAASSGSAK